MGNALSGRLGSRRTKDHAGEAGEAMRSMAHFSLANEANLVRVGVPVLRRGAATMSATEEALKNNEAYAASFDKGGLPMPPAKHLAVLACMDARLHVSKILGLEIGDAHIIRNAGGVATDDAIQSLVISQRLLGTSEIILIHHTDCGMLTFSDDAVKRQIQDEVGIKPEFALEAFADLDEDVRQSINRIKASPFIPHKDNVRGFVYSVETGQLRQVA